MEDWKSPDVSAAGMISRNNQKGPSLSQVNETENSKEIFDVSKSPILRLEVEAKQEIKEEPTNEVFKEIKTEIEIEDWKPPDVSDVSGTNNQNPLLHSHLNELENLNDFVNTSKGPMIKLEGLYL